MSSSLVFVLAYVCVYPVCGCELCFSPAIGIPPSVQQPRAMHLLHIVSVGHDTIELLLPPNNVAGPSSVIVNCTDAESGREHTVLVSGEKLSQLIKVEGLSADTWYNCSYLLRLDFNVPDQQSAAISLKTGEQNFQTCFCLMQGS